MSKAELWLTTYMAERRAVPSQTAKSDAARAGIRERTLQRAARSLGLTVESRGFPRATWWELPSRASRDTAPPPPHPGGRKPPRRCACGAPLETLTLIRAGRCPGCQAGGAA